VTCKLVYLARRAAGVAREDWPRTWRSHAVFASQFPVLEAKIEWMRYCNRSAIELPGVSLAHDGVAVAASDTLAGLDGTGFGDADRARIDADELRVFDMPTPYFTYYCEEDVLRDGPLGEAAVFRFLAEGGEAPVPPAATRHVLNRPLHKPRPLFPFALIAESWFASESEAVAAVANKPPDTGGDVTLLTTVCHRWPKA
jgi:hypothetical protein